LAGFVIAAVTEASEVVISDGNPQVVDCILLLYLLNIDDNIFYFLMLVKEIINCIVRIQYFFLK
jgi:hypothetical protein